jgi:hypothetical protein
VVFLNDRHGAGELNGFDGGELHVHGLLDGFAFEVPARARRLVAFGVDVIHEVTPITRGERFTLVTWYSRWNAGHGRCRLGRSELMVEEPVIRLRGADLTWRELDESVVVLDLKASRYLSVTGTGAFLWKRLASGASVDSLVRAVLDAYEVDDAVARADVAGFLADLGREQLLEAASES